MATLTIELPDELLDELEDVSSQLKSSLDDTILLALSHIMQKETLYNAIEGINRADEEDDSELLSFPELKDELDFDLNFHNLAIEELDELDEEEQVELIGQLIERLTHDDEDGEPTVDLVLRDEEDASLILSCFDFGEVVYRLSDVVTIYHIAINSNFEEDEEFDEVFDEDFEEEVVSGEE